MAIIAGPILRRVEADSAFLWLATDAPASINACICRTEGTGNTHQVDNKTFQILSQPAHAMCKQAGNRLYIHLIKLDAQSSYPKDILLFYDISLDGQWLPETERKALSLSTLPLPSFTIPTKIDHFLHGSCRRLHHKSDDCLALGEHALQRTQTNLAQRPACLFLTGDQIYADDVGGATLLAIQQVVNRYIGHEQLPDNIDTQTLQTTPLYRRKDQLIPAAKVRTQRIRRRGRLIKEEKKELILTTGQGENHLFSLGEYLGHYLISLSPLVWEGITLPQASDIDLPRNRVSDYEDSRENVQRLLDDNHLLKVRRLLANVPTYMVFDDHEVTDDWNITSQWEARSKANLLSKHIIGNGLLAYWLFQGWGNNPSVFADTDNFSHRIKDNDNSDLFQAGSLHVSSKLIDAVHTFKEWRFTVNTSPFIISLDARTQRTAHQQETEPRGLLNDESLAWLQHALVNEKADTCDEVICISPTPLFGIRTIEWGQNTMHRISKLLNRNAVIEMDIENWVAHPATFEKMLNVLATSTQQPLNFVVLSGDVHYSFNQDIHIQRVDDAPNGTHIQQFTCSACKNSPNVIANAALDIAINAPAEINHTSTLKTKGDQPVHFKLTRRFNTSQSLSEFRLKHLGTRRTRTPLYLKPLVLVGLPSLSVVSRNPHPHYRYTQKLMHWVRVNDGLQEMTSEYLPYTGTTQPNRRFLAQQHRHRIKQRLPMRRARRRR